MTNGDLSPARQRSATKKYVVGATIGVVSLIVLVLASRMALTGPQATASHEDPSREGQANNRSIRDVQTQNDSDSVPAKPEQGPLTAVEREVAQHLESLSQSPGFGDLPLEKKTASVWEAVGQLASFKKLKPEEQVVLILKSSAELAGFSEVPTEDLVISVFQKYVESINFQEISEDQKFEFFLESCARSAESPEGKVAVAIKSLRQSSATKAITPQQEVQGLLELLIQSPNPFANMLISSRLVQIGQPAIVPLRQCVSYLQAQQHRLMSQQAALAAAYGLEEVGENPEMHALIDAEVSAEHAINEIVKNSNAAP